MSVDFIEARHPRLAATNASLFRAVVLILFVLAAWAMLTSLGEMRSTALASGLFRTFSP
jgi:hypothetical protein